MPGLRHLLLCGATTLIAACASAPIAVPTAGPIAGPVPVGGQANARNIEFEDRLNALRGAHGLPPAQFSPSLTATAQQHAEFMTANDSISHVGVNGLRPTARARALGHPSCYTVENLAWDWPTWQRAMAGWETSLPHLNNLLIGRHVQYGLGISERNYVLMIDRGC